MSLGWARVPEGQKGWNGYWGTVPIQGPDPMPPGWRNVPHPSQRAEADIETRWTCVKCGQECEVGGVAIDEWMECTYRDCGGESYLT